MRRSLASYLRFLLVTACITVMFIVQNAGAQDKRGRVGDEICDLKCEDRPCIHHVIYQDDGTLIGNIGRCARNEDGNCFCQRGQDIGYESPDPATN